MVSKSLLIVLLNHSLASAGLKQTGIYRNSVPGQLLNHSLASAGLKLANTG